MFVKCPLCDKHYAKSWGSGNKENRKKKELKKTKTKLLKKKIYFRGFPGGAVIKNLPANAGDTGSSPGPGRSHMPRSS